MQAKLLPLAAALSFAAMTPAHATDIPANGSKAYVVDSDGNIVRDGFGGCVRTIDWTKATAIAKCEGWPEAKKPAKKASAEPKETKPEKPAAQEAPKPQPSAPAKDTQSNSNDSSNNAAKAAAATAVIVKEDTPAAFQGFFVSGKANLTSQAKDKLDVYADYMERHPNLKVKISGYTDSLGSKTFNQRLSKTRAEQVKHYLEQKGIAADRIQAVGNGPKNPVATNKTAEGRAKNRRVEIEILK